MTDVESELSNELLEGSFKRLCVRDNSERTELLRFSDDMEYQVLFIDLGFLWRQQYSNTATATTKKQGRANGERASDFRDIGRLDGAFSFW